MQFYSHPHTETIISHINIATYVLYVPNQVYEYEIHKIESL